MLAFDDDLKHILGMLKWPRGGDTLIVTVCTETVRETIDAYGLTDHVFSPDEMPELLAERDIDVLVAKDATYTLGRYLAEARRRMPVLDLNIMRLPSFHTAQRLMTAYRAQHGEERCLIVGSSLGYYGFLPSAFPMPAINFSSISQDYYYSSRLVETAIETDAPPRYVIFTLMPYGFHWDLSQSSESYRVFPLAFLLHDTHHLGVSYEQLGDIFDASFFACPPADAEEAIDLDDPDGLRADFDRSMGIREYCLARSRAEQWKTRRFPDSVKENIACLDACIQLCRAHDILLVFVMPPHTELYRTYFSDEVFGECCRLLTDRMRMSEGKALCLDYYDSVLFSEADFFDCDHLNRSGAQKLSALVSQEIIRWESAHRSGLWPSLKKLFHRM